LNFIFLFIQTNGFRNAVPTISYKRNSNGVTLLWSTKSEAIADFVENYRVKEKSFIIDLEIEFYGEFLDHG